MFFAAALFTFFILLFQTLAQTIVVTTVSPANPTNIPSFISDQLFQDSILNSTNVYRSDYNASAVQWNQSLADYASNYTSKCDFSHSGGPYGENLAEGYLNVTATVDAWGNEAAQYDFSSGDFSESTGHFTQLVWKATTAVGCGRRYCNGQGDIPNWYIACEYYPRGNIVGNFTQNVDSCSNSTACGAAGALLPAAWRTQGDLLASSWAFWWIIGLGLVMAL